MSISEADIVFKKPVVITNTSVNGGRCGVTEVQSGVRHSLFPRVTKAERVAGVTRYRKQFLCNDNADDEAANGVLVWDEIPSNGGDRHYVRKGTQIDTQGDLTTYDPLRIGCGRLSENITAGDDQCQILMKNDDYVFPNGDYLHIANKVWTGCVIATDVKVGDSVEYNDLAAEWQKTTFSSDITYPKGWCVGTDLVMTVDGDTKEEWLQIDPNVTEDEIIGVGDGADLHPPLTTLVNVSYGICRKRGVDESQPDYPVVVTAAKTGGGFEYAYFNPDGTLDTVTSDATAGQLNMLTGQWTVEIVWKVAPADPGSGEDNITCTYAENSFLYAGNVATVRLAPGETFQENYTGDETTYVAACLYEEEVVSAYGALVVTTAGDGDYDDEQYPIETYNDGTIEDYWTLTFSSSTAFTCVGAYTGSIGSGVIGEDFSVLNPDTGEPYFLIHEEGWTGTWAEGDTMEFSTSPSAMGIWMEEVVPPATEAESDNLTIVGMYCE